MISHLTADVVNVQQHAVAVEKAMFRVAYTAIAKRCRIIAATHCKIFTSDVLSDTSTIVIPSLYTKTAILS